MYLYMMKVKKKLYTYEYTGIYFTVFASSGKPIDSSFAFRLVFYLIRFFFPLSERLSKT